MFNTAVNLWNVNIYENVNWRFVSVVDWNKFGCLYCLFLVACTVAFHRHRHVSSERCVILLVFSICVISSLVICCIFLHSPILFTIHFFDMYCNHALFRRGVWTLLWTKRSFQRDKVGRQPVKLESFCESASVRELTSIFELVFYQCLNHWLSEHFSSNTKHFCLKTWGVFVYGDPCVRPRTNVLRLVLRNFAYTTDVRPVLFPLTGTERRDGAKFVACSGSWIRNWWLMTAPMNIIMAMVTLHWGRDHLFCTAYGETISLTQTAAEKMHRFMHWHHSVHQKPHCFREDCNASGGRIEGRKVGRFTSSMRVSRFPPDPCCVMGVSSRFRI